MSIFISAPQRPADDEKCRLKRYTEIVELTFEHGAEQKMWTNDDAGRSSYLTLLQHHKDISELLFLPQRNVSVNPHLAVFFLHAVFGCITHDYDLCVFKKNTMSGLFTNIREYCRDPNNPANVCTAAIAVQSNVNHSRFFLFFQHESKFVPSLWEFDNDQVRCLYFWNQKEVELSLSIAKDGIIHALELDDCGEFIVRTGDTCTVYDFSKGWVCELPTYGYFAIDYPEYIAGYYQSLFDKEVPFTMHSSDRTVTREDYFGDSKGEIEASRQVSYYRNADELKRSHIPVGAEQYEHKSCFVPKAPGAALFGPKKQGYFALISRNGISLFDVSQNLQTAGLPICKTSAFSTIDYVYCFDDQCLVVGNGKSVKLLHICEVPTSQQALTLPSTKRLSVQLSKLLGISREDLILNAVESGDLDTVREELKSSQPVLFATSYGTAAPQEFGQSLIQRLLYVKQTKFTVSSILGLVVQYNRDYFVANGNAKNFLYEILAKALKIRNEIVATALLERIPFTGLDAFSDISGRSLLVIATQNQLLDAVNSLIERGANVNVRTEKSSPLFEAINSQPEQYEIVYSLLSRPPKKSRTQTDVNYTINGWTPLTTAVRRGYARTVKVLLDFGAQKTLANSSGETPLQVAQRLKNEEIVKLLR